MFNDKGVCAATVPTVSSTRSRILGVGLAALAVAWALFRVAPAPLPDLPRFVGAIGNWREATPDPDYDHLRENLVFQWLFEPAASLGVNVYLLQWLIGVILVVGGLAWIYRANVAPQWRGTALRLAILSPVAAIMVGFFGSYDPVTMGLAVVLVALWLANRSRGVVIVGAFLGLQHFGQALAMIVALGLTTAALSDDGPRRAIRLTLWALAGTAVGKGLAIVILRLASGSAVGSRVPPTTEVIATSNAIVTTVNYFPILLVSLFAGAWAIVIGAFLVRSPRGRLLLIAAAVVASYSLVFTDQTRIFVLLSFPSVALLTVYVLRKYEASPRAIRGIEAMAWIITPVLLWTDSDGVGRVQYLGALDAQIMAWQQIFGWG